MPTRLCLLLLPALLAAQPLDPKVLDRLEWRAIGPANMGGRTADVEGVPGNPSLVYAATASGGLWKTVNGGHTWAPIFERESTISIGDMALDPRNPDVIWVGAGESNVRNSVSFGDGVYKSTDGGKTWRHLGLRDTERISRIVINPLNTDVVLVGALGHAFGPNEERGVFLTTDGGRGWQKTLYVDAGHGVSDMDIDPANPNIVYAALWRFERKPWTHSSGSEQGGVFQSSDGGRTWKKLANGLPKLLGRIGVKVSPGNPRVVYVIAESREGTLFRSDDGGETFRLVSRERNIVGRGFYYADLRVDPQDENRLYAVAGSLQLSIDGGKTFRRISGRTHADYHALWIDPKNPARLWQGQDGGIAVSYDRGETWEYVNNLPLGQFYQIHADNRQPFYWVSGGLQDNGSWIGPSRTREPAGILNDDWRMLSFGDGFHVTSHPDDPDLLLSESQGGNILRTDLRTREQQSVSPQPRSGAGGPAGALKYRFNWNTPLVASPHEKNTVLFAGNVVFQSRDFGRTWEAISQDLTTNDPAKLKDAGGPIWFDNSTAENHATIISLAESPARRGVIWAGSDDGNLQVTFDGGKSWTNVAPNLPGLPPHSPVSHVEPSRTGDRMAYAAFDRHMFDDFRPHVFKTADGGRSWTRLTAGLPEKAYVHVLREDPRNPSLLYAGTELGLYASWNAGGSWLPLRLKNLPTVAVHDLLVHPRENDLVLGTHGRSIYILDDATPIQQLSPAVLATDTHLFDIRPALRFTARFTRYGIGNKPFAGPNPPYGALLTYYLKEPAAEKATVKIEILDSAGRKIRELARIPREQGLHRVHWDLRHEAARQRRPPTEEETEFTGPPRGPQVVPGVYTARLTAGDRVLEKPVEVRLDPALSVPQADLAAQFDHALRLRDMLSAVNETLLGLDSLKQQLQQAEKTVLDRAPDTARQLGKSFTDWIHEVSRVQAMLGRLPDAFRLEKGPGLAENLDALLRSIDGVNAAPTAAQRAYFAELQSGFRTAMAEANGFLSRTVPEWNEALRKLGAPTVLPGKPVEVRQPF